MVVQIFVWAHNDVDTDVSLDAFDGRCMGTAFVGADLLRHAVQADNTRQIASSSGLMSRLEVIRKSTVSPAPSTAR